MNTRFVKSWYLYLLFAASCCTATVSKPEFRYAVPVSGNSWVTETMDTRDRIITRKGIENWTRPEVNIRTFFWIEKSAALEVALRARVTSGESQLKCWLGDTTHHVTLDNTEYETVVVGTYTVPHTGYHHLDMQGLEKTAATFALVTDILLGGEATAGKAYFVKDDFYFGRRGPSVHLRRLHSFLENFIPATGQYPRKGVYGNQWIYDSSGNWTELVVARFTADATARKESRLDYAGGVEGDTFFMKNCGFFNERSEIGTIYTRKPSGKKPEIDFSELP